MDTIKLVPGDAGYPSAAEVLGGPTRLPPVLYVRGVLPVLPGVAVVGTRAPTEQACAFARTLTTALVKEGIAVWSGGAVGIDAVAHEAAIEAGGITVLVAGGGLNRPYPLRHRSLFERVVETGGALLSRVPDGTPPMAPLFLMRNEVLAALTSVTVVIQAGIESGARSTAAAARRLGRALCVVPHAPWDQRGQGCALELARGAHAVYDAAQVLAALGRPSPPPAPRRPRKRRPPEPSLLPLALQQPLEPLEAQVLAVIDASPAHQDEVCERAGLAASGVVAALLTLTLLGVVVEGPAGFYRRTTCPPDAAGASPRLLFP